MRDIEHAIYWMTHDKQLFLTVLPSLLKYMRWLIQAHTLTAVWSYPLTLSLGDPNSTSRYLNEDSCLPDPLHLVFILRGHA